ncbi:MAG: hypothetical protein HY064_00560 [Bacteroidetes bacterium]|nr:hypothetical protein [Bacteroidota bacterium]
MKNLAAVLFISFSFFLASCEKEELPTPATTGTTATTSTVSVEYRVSSVSGHFTATYSVMENGAMTEKTYNYDRTQNSITFNTAPGTNLSVKAHNSIPSGDEVEVEIWVNGALFKSGTADAPGAIAIAEGKY